jgi:hypothetical protein
MRIWMGAAAVALLCAPAAALAPAEEPVPAGLEKVEGALRHGATGLAFPDKLGGMPRFVSGIGGGVTAMYLDLFSGKAVMVGAIERQERPEFETMRRDARDTFHETGVPTVVEESAFTWPGHAEAATFHGRYSVGPYGKDYWRAHAKGWDVNVIVTTPRGDRKALDKFSAQVAAEVFGGATLDASGR